MSLIPLPLFIEVRHAELGLKIEDTYEMFGTKQRFTRHVNNPKLADFNDVKALANRLEVPPLLLFDKYGMCSEFKKIRTKVRQFYHLIPITNSTLKHGHNSTSPITASDFEVAGANP